MDIEYLAKVLARLQPLVRNKVIKRTGLERVLNTVVTPPPGLKEEVERLLHKAGISIIEVVVPELEVKKSIPPTNLPLDSAPAHSVSKNSGDTAVEAARLRLEIDSKSARATKRLLTAQEEIGLATLIRGPRKVGLEKGDFAKLVGESRAAAEALLLHNQRLVYSVAQKYSVSGMTLDDLAQHGNIGLIRAVELYDPAQGNKFSTYAINWIRQSITRGIANEARLIRLPVHVIERLQKVWQKRNELTINGKEPTVKQLALVCSLSEKQVSECLALGPHDLLSLDTPVGPESETTLGDLYDRPDPHSDPDTSLNEKMLKEIMTSVLATLPERESAIIRMRYGIDDDIPRTLAEIGEVFGVTRERIRQLENKSMMKLQHPSRSCLLKPYSNQP